MKNAEWRGKAAQSRITFQASWVVSQKIAKGTNEASDCFLFYILPSSFFIHRTAPRPPPHCPHTAWLAAKRPSQICECRRKNAE